ncbi:hypothetical protein P5G50_05670 [Leifsonia sp. F6_8S_P_1B]|uniref:DUF7882 domain-containing protein n=1 Tax=Leifsonia williamsii TaxID=3035919 RepID=A0ABT8K914_9MICO|nr:hypothetical protein [Leifsonia williamsii]MDN4613938.1 hypothetical protein [Leifsonia williamsii]
MGVLSYGGSEYEFDDRVLSHLQVVITTKLRRRESFALTWVPENGEYGRESIWVDNGFPIRFRFSQPGASPLNREWLEQLMDGTHRPAGLVLTAESGRSEDQPARRGRVPSAHATTA